MNTETSDSDFPYEKFYKSALKLYKKREINYGQLFSRMKYCGCNPDGTSKKSWLYKLFNAEYRKSSRFFNTKDFSDKYSENDFIWFPSKISYF
jgi:hypothetical protein